MSSPGRTPLIALLTDLGAADAYVGVMKAVILGLCPAAGIVDLCHEVQPQDVEEAALLLDMAWPYCPKDTVHVIVVDPGVGSERRLLAVGAHDQIFLAPDNGVLTYVLERAESFRAFSLQRREHWLPKMSDTFHGRDILAPVAARLACGLPIEAVGPPVADLVRFPVSRPVVAKDTLAAHIIHVDRFGNLVTDLTEDEFDVWWEGEGGGSLLIRVGDSAIKGLRRAYAEARAGEPLALFGSSGRLEVSVNRGSAACRLGAGKGSVVVLERVR